MYCHQTQLRTCSQPIAKLVAHGRSKHVEVWGSRPAGCRRLTSQRRGERGLSNVLAMHVGGVYRSLCVAIVISTCKVQEEASGT